MGFFAGPALAGFLLAFANVPTAFAFDALTFVWSALFVVTIRYPAKESPNVAASASASIPEDVKAESFLERAAQGFRVVFQNRDVLTLGLRHPR